MLGRLDIFNRGCWVLLLGVNIGALVTSAVVFVLAAFYSGKNVQQCMHGMSWRGLEVQVADRLQVRVA